MSHTLHVGLHPDHVGELECDNDHWEQWGEERPAGEAVHAYVEVDSLVNAVEALARILDSHKELVPMYYANQEGTLAVITPSNDWSEALLVVSGEGV